MPAYPLKQSMLSGIFDAVNLRKVSPSPPELWPLEVPNANSSRYIPASRCIPFYSGKHKACRPSQPQASRMLHVLPKDVEETSNCNSKYGSDDSEHDLAAMVHDFIENGSNSKDISDPAKMDNRDSIILKLNDTLQALVSSMSSSERDLLWSIATGLMNVNETDLVCRSAAASCNGACIGNVLVKNLKLAGYNAALCKIKWIHSGRVPGGEYEYIDVILPDRSSATNDRIIIDPDFQSQFEIARPVAQYQATLKLLPTIFIGKPAKLEQILQIMSKAAKCSLKQNSMPFPPWRTLEYMKAKWFSACQRSSVDHTLNPRQIMRMPEASGTKRCAEQLVHLKTFLKKETEMGLTTLKTITNRGKIFSRAKTAFWS
eukprot:Gb_09444 [translate_table: standard]